MNVADETEALDLARRALSEYGLVDYALEAIGQSGSYAFLVTSKDRCVLKLHTHARKGLRSAMVWLEALGRSISVTVPTPIRNRQDDLVTYLEYGDQRLPATLHRWVAGEHYRGTPVWREYRPIPFTAEWSRRAGEMVADVHGHSKAWEMPGCFVRPTWDLDWMCRYLPGLELMCKEGTITENQFDQIQRAATRVCKELHAFEKTEATWGIIHGDLNPLNLIVRGNEVRPLDFDLCGFGYFLQDISYLFLWLTPDNRQHFLAGYQSKQPLPDNYRELLTSFLIFSLIPMLKFWLPNRVLLDEMCARYLDGRLRPLPDEKYSKENKNVCEIQ